MRPAQDAGGRGRALGAPCWVGDREEAFSLTLDFYAPFLFATERKEKSDSGVLVHGPPRGGLPSPWHRLVSGRQALCLSLYLPAPGTGPAWQVTLIADTLRAPALCPLPAACAVIQPISQVERPRPREAEWLARDKHLEVDTRTHPRHFGPRGGLCDHWATLPLSTRVE